MGDDHGSRGSGSAPSRGRPAAGSSVLTPPTGMSVVPGTVPGDVRDLLSTDTAWELPSAGAPTGFGAPCRCGHASDVHRHWRRGSDCGQCGVGACTAYRPRGGGLRRLLRSVGLLP